MSNQPILSLMPILMLSGCAFYSTYPVYDYERANAQTVISSAEFSGELFMTEFRGAGVIFGAAYNNVYVGSTSTRTRMWQDPNAERFVDRVESAGISVRSPDPKYTIDVRQYCNGEQNLGTRWLWYLGSITFLSRTENLYCLQIRIYEKRTGELIAKRRIPFTGYTLRFCIPLWGPWVDRNLDVPHDDQVMTWYLQAADYAIDEIRKHIGK